MKFQAADSLKYVILSGWKFLQLELTKVWDVKHSTPTSEETSSMTAYQKNWWINFQFAFEKFLASLWYWRPLNHDALFYAHHSNQGKIALRFFRDQFWDNTLQPSSSCLSDISDIQKLWMFWWAIENIHILEIVCKFSFLGVITSIFILMEKSSRFSFVKLVIFKQNPQRAKKCHKIHYLSRKI